MLGGGAAGGMAYGLQFSLFTLFMMTRSDLSEVTAPVVLAVLIVPPLFLALFTVPAFLLGVALVGWPLWCVMDRIGWRSPWLGIPAGGLAAGLVGEALVAVVLPGASLMRFAWLVLPGAVAGLIAWRMIYSRPVRPPPARPS
jgi:hypothetical protein